MNKNFVIAGLVALAAVLGAGGYQALKTPSIRAPSDVGDPVAGLDLYQQSCAACHGANLQGQPNWQYPDQDGLLPAPPHNRTGHTWHHSDQLLFSYTKFGGKETMARQGVDFNSAMPGFGDQLNDQQIWDILAYIKSTWPDRVKRGRAPPAGRE